MPGEVRTGFHRADAFLNRSVGPVEDQLGVEGEADDAEDEGDKDDAVRKADLTGDDAVRKAVVQQVAATTATPPPRTGRPPPNGRAASGTTVGELGPEEVSA